MAEQNVGLGEPIVKGSRVGRLVMIEEAEPEILPSSNSKHKRWLALCDCGKTRIVAQRTLRHAIRAVGCRISCGCLGREIHSEFCKALRTHCQSKVGERTLEYKTWISMNDRCNNENNHAYEYYGGRGIKVCERWTGKDGFINFLADMGKRPTPKHTIDRYPNKNGDYEPSNCRWATMKEQTRNLSNNVFVEVNGERIYFADFIITIRTDRDTASYWIHKKGFTPQFIYDVAMKCIEKGEKLTYWKLRDASKESVR